MGQVKKGSAFYSIQMGDEKPNKDRYEMRDKDGKVTSFEHMDEITAMMKDKRYKTDEAYRDKVQELIKGTPNSVFPSLYNKETDFSMDLEKEYREAVEASFKKAMRDPRYKHDPEYRYEIHRKMAENMPFVNEHFGDRAKRVGGTTRVNLEMPNMSFGEKMQAKADALKIAIEEHYPKDKQ